MVQNSSSVEAPVDVFVFQQYCANVACFFESVLLMRRSSGARALPFGRLFGTVAIFAFIRPGRLFAGNSGAHFAIFGRCVFWEIVWRPQCLIAGGI